MSKKEKTEKKCIAVHLPVDLFEKLDTHKTRTGKSQSKLITEFIEKGLNVSKDNNTPDKLFYFVKVRIDVNKMMEFGQKLQSGEIDNSHTLVTFCIKEDPAVGLNIWQANDKESFERAFSVHSKYYKEILEVTPVVTAGNAMKLLLQNIQK
jgi:metal-responsive CopG/Arc/MetJ family transcriptional regulator